MKWALYIPYRNNIGNLHGDLKEIITKIPAHELNTIKELFGEINFNQLYFGQEFCERILPKKKDIIDALNFAHSNNMQFTFITPYVTETGLIKLQQLFIELVKIKSDCEIVINDWGVLYLIFNEFPSFTPILGRLLNKMWRDPRIKSYLKGKNSDKILKTYQGCGLAAPGMKKLLNKFNIKRIEIDNLIHGVNENISDWGYQISMYVPYGCITTGRMCILGSWGLEKKDKFKATSKFCSQQCRFYSLNLYDQNKEVKNTKDWEIIQKGNTIFYKQLEPMLKNGLTQAGSLGVDRIIYQFDPI
ncbi:MAG: hypothetical protein PWP31_7 [Clostridia bacterium]|nr:hypothetical protein [Clostridia bacterium]